MGLLDRVFARSAPAEERSYPGPYLSISDPALAEYLGVPLTDAVAGVTVTDRSALGVTAFWRGVNIVAGTIAGLPLKTYANAAGGRAEVASWLDDPAAPYPLSPFAWTELVLVHMLLRGEAFLRHNYNAAGALIGTWPVFPGAVEDVRWKGTGKAFTIRNADGQTETLDDQRMTQVMGLTLDGLRGVSVLTFMRHAIGLGIANERAAGRTLGAGMSVRALVTPEEDLTPDDAKTIKADLEAKLTGVDNAGGIAVVNRKLKVSPFELLVSPEDAQFLQSRQFQVEEFARITGVPPHLLFQTDKQTSWGTGVAEQNLGLARYTFRGWTSRLEQAITRFTLPPGQLGEFEYAGLLQGTPADEIRLLIEQVDAGLLTVDEARAIRNLPPLPKPRPTVVPPAAEGAA